MHIETSTQLYIEVFAHFQNPLGIKCSYILQKMYWAPQSKYVDYWSSGFILRGVECLQVMWSRDADEEHVQDFSFAFSYILNLLQQNSLSCFLTGFSCLFFFPPFVLKVSALDYRSSGNCSPGCFLRKRMIVVDLQVEAKKQHLESRCLNV